MKDAKDIMSKHAKERYLYLSSSLDEIYSEEIEVYYDGSSSTVCGFDYGLLYGNFQKFAVGGLIISDYSRIICNEDNDAGVVLKISSIEYADPNILLYSNEDHGHDQCLYNCPFLGYVLQDVISGIDTDTIGDPVPVSTFRKIGRIVED